MDLLDWLRDFPQGSMHDAGYALSLVQAAAWRPEFQMVKLDDYPQLRLLCWSAPHISEISESDAFALYEREWWHVDQAQLTAHERELIERLTRTLGRGVLLV